MSTPPRRRRQEDATSALIRVITAIDIVKGSVSIQLGQGVLSSASGILLIIRDTIKNKEDFRELIDQCDWLRQLIGRTNWAAREGEMSSMLSKALAELSSAIEGVHEDVVLLDTRKVFRRLWASLVDKERIKDWTTSLDRSLKYFALRLDMAMAESLHNVEKDLQTALAKAEIRRDGLLPPPPPTIFCGRNELVGQVRDALLSVSNPERRHTALLGPGGIGKSSLAKAVVNEPTIRDKFKNRRFFIPFGDILPSQITYQTFTERVARMLGISGTDHHDISDALRRVDTLLVFDNAETFLDTRTSRDASRIRGAIDEFGAFPSVSILFTSRSRELPPSLRCNKFSVPNLDSQAAYDVFTKVYRREVVPSTSILDTILSVVGYHPLTIILLAHVAEVNEWTIGDLARNWNARRTQLLNTGHGKDANLADCIELSLNSPSIRIYGHEASIVLRMIAFFPQGVPRTNLERIFPSIPRIQDIINTLHRQSLVFFNDGFVTLLVPIRLYITDTIRLPDTYLLEAARKYYYSSISGPGHDVETLIKSEDVNIESLIVFDLETLKREKLITTLNSCGLFIAGLTYFKPRPVCFRSLLHRVDTSRSPHLTAAKMRCFRELSHMARHHATFDEALALYRITYDFAQRVDDKEEALDAILNMANTLNVLGQYGAAQQALDCAYAARKQGGAKAHQKAYEAFIEASVKQCTDAGVTGESLARLYLESRRFSEVSGKAWDTDMCTAEAALALALIDGDTVAARTAFESAISALQASDEHRPSLVNLFYCLADVAFLEGEMEETKQLLSLTRTGFIRLNLMSSANRILIDMAMSSIAQWKFHDARELIKQANKEAKSQGIVSDSCRRLKLYTSGALELASGCLPKAYKYFEQTKQYCEDQQEFHLRACSSRAMGEIAILQKDTQKAKTHFDETAAICAEAGIVPKLLYRRSDFIFLGNTPPATYEGWPRFLEEQAPM